MTFSNVSNKTFIVCTYAFAIVLILFSIFLSIQFDIPFSSLSRDPSSVTETRPYIGFISNVGVMFWSFSTSICIFTYSILSLKENIPKEKFFVLFAGLISFFLLIDDFFMFHERVFPWFFHLDEKLLFGFYGILMLFYLIRFKSLILRNQYIILLIALGLFAISILFDILLEEKTKNRHFFEDVPKFMGIISWFCFHFLVCKNILKEVYLKE